MTAVADSAGITMVPLAGLAPHPLNPRTSLGDLAELAASIAAQGLFEPLVVLSAAAHAEAAQAARGGNGHPLPGITHVIVMGHRRHEAARQAGLAAVPVLVRDDLAGPAAVAAMIAENRHREGLDPLAEASAMAGLARLGWRQRRIAAETGCSQAHVSKRMALLQLPEPARDALAGGSLSVADALELHKLTGAGEVAGEVIGQAIREIEQGHHPAAVLSMAKSQLGRAQAAEKTRAKLESEGIEVITDQRRERMGWPRVYGDTSAHARAGCLAALIGWSGEPDYVCTNPAGHPEELSPHGRREARAHEDEREGRKAAKARDVACAAIVAGPLPPARVLLHLITTALLDGGGGHAESMRMAARWLAESGAAPRGVDHYRLRDQLAAGGDRGGLQRYAYAYALAGDEARVRSRWASWDEHHIAHFERLGAAGYEPTAWEQDRLAEAQACADARGSLACPHCGCTSASGSESSCRVGYDREQGQVAYECGWDCGRHRAAGKEAGS